MSFHEVGGLILCGLFLVHKGLNWKWITDVSKKLFGKSLTAKTRFGYLVDILLLVSMTFIAVSGVMISKTIFRSISGEGMFWKMGHYFAAAAAIILVGVHIGLHWSFIRNMSAKVLKLPRIVARPLGIICLAVILIYGGYSAATTSFPKWLASPLTTFGQSGVRLQKWGERPEGLPQKGESSEGFARSKGGQVKPGEFQGGSSLSPGRILGVIASYGSITSIFAVITIMIGKGKVLRKKNRKIPDNV